MKCSHTFNVAFLGLLLFTSGFVLTLTSWSAPAINNFVRIVRLIGPCSLVSGVVLVIVSCLTCALDQGRCCRCCYVILGRYFTFEFMRKSPIVTSKSATMTRTQGANTNFKSSRQNNGGTRIPEQKVSFASRAAEHYMYCDSLALQTNPNGDIDPNNRHKPKMDRKTSVTVTSKETKPSEEELSMSWV